MTKDEKLALLETLVREDGDTTALVYSRMYGMLSAYVRDEDLNAMLEHRSEKVAK